VTGIPKDPLGVPEHYTLWRFEKQSDTWMDARIFPLLRPKEELAKKASNGRDKAGPSLRAMNLQLRKLASSLLLKFEDVIQEE
jgi:hypothetical protein